MKKGQYQEDKRVTKFAIILKQGVLLELPWLGDGFYTMEVRFSIIVIVHKNDKCYKLLYIFFFAKCRRF